MGDQYSAHIAKYDAAAKAVADHNNSSYKVWKKLFFFVFLPVTSAALVKSVILAEHHYPKESEYVKYPALRVRNKPFFWGDGDHSMFHDDRYNRGFGRPDEPEHH